MKKFIMLVLSLGMCFTLASCGDLLSSTESSSSTSSTIESSNNQSESSPKDSTSDSSSQEETEYVTVTFKQDGQVEVVKTVKKGESLTDIPSPVDKAGYSVVWDKTDYTNIQADMTVTAQYTANTYTVTYEAEGFAIDGTTTTLTYHAACSALDMTLTQEGYTFLGWKYGEVTYTSTSVWNVADNVTLIADWTAKDRVVVTFTDTDGSTINKTIYKGGNLMDIPTPKAKTGYTIDTETWYTDAECTAVATFIDLQENVTVYAKAIANKYTVTYNANGGTVANTTQEVTYDADYILETPTHAESYMRFDGWKNDDGNVIVLSGEWTIASNVSLTAQWTDTRKAYTISFIQAGQETKTFSVIEGQDFTDIPTPVAKTGYTVEWDRTRFTNVTENITVTAIETAKTYTITLNANGGSVSQTTITVTYGQEYQIPMPQHDDNCFDAWIYNGTEVASQGVWNIDVEGTELITLTATWGDREWTGNY